MSINLSTLLDISPSSSICTDCSFIRFIKSPTKTHFFLSRGMDVWVLSFFTSRGHDGTPRRANLSLSSVITFYILRYRLSSAGPSLSVTSRWLNQEAKRFLFFKYVYAAIFHFLFSGASWSQISIKVKCCYLCCWQQSWFYFMYEHLRLWSSSVFQRCTNMQSTANL